MSHFLFLITYLAGQDYVPGLLNFVNFQPPGNATACTSFDIIDDQIGLEDLESFIVDVIPIQGPVRIGRINRTVVHIEDNDSMLPSSQILYSFLGSCLYACTHSQD